jgi:hypothetical protein
MYQQEIGIREKKDRLLSFLYQKAPYNERCFIVLLHSELCTKGSSSVCRRWEY